MVRQVLSWLEMGLNPWGLEGAQGKLVTAGTLFSFPRLGIFLSVSFSVSWLWGGYYGCAYARKGLLEISWEYHCGA